MEQKLHLTFGPRHHSHPDLKTAALLCGSVHESAFVRGVMVLIADISDGKKTAAGTLFAQEAGQRRKRCGGATLKRKTLKNRQI